MTLLFWLLFCAFIGYSAGRKGRSRWAWGLAAFFLSPLIVGIVLALMPDGDGKKETRPAPSPGGNRDSGRREEKYCPECGYLADAGEQYCPRCGEMLW
ncbi:MAG: zinc-ribbon domain-containing protein [Schwartzia sp.]|nr:zinc-ribbon domain-containing protein [Schwartzia sp. (in: firmicutes)]